MNILDIFRILLLISPIALVLAFLYQKKSRIDLRSKISNGMICYNCKYAIKQTIPPGKGYDWIPAKKMLCKSCERDIKLDEIEHKKKSKFLMSILNHPNPIMIIAPCFIISCMISAIAIFIHIPTLREIMQITSSILLVFGYIVQITSFRMNSVPK